MIVHRPLAGCGAGRPQSDRGAGARQPGTTGRPSRTRADQKCPHEHAYHAIVNVLPLSGGTCTCPHDGHGIARACRRSPAVMTPTGSNSRADPDPARKDTPRQSRDGQGGTLPATVGETPAGRLREPEFLDAVANLIAVQPEQRRRPGLIAPTALERLHHQAALELLEIDALRRQLKPPRLAPRRSAAGSPRARASRLSLSSIARSMALRSSRMLPGQP